ncbi:hypothetical protein [Streptococcus suis]|uniref:Uncharacterized protein n=1 Tax=Streptococcus suis TaxID=1307 RepID=A0A3S6JAN0_STRSU|nr:hypothetical protein [Streptococcus suis]ASW49035.1 hypothetical protein A7J08_01525 [Streptococcus suis]NQM47114.1 hypothetical protein [Streptococcus suis]HEL1780846.1 hypothetical protein [Streptococcus suis]HEM2811338.1 hypothetical protein [Streptococcus suis]HEM4289285.1 hypothetical protein [Streptococcus suis]
MNIKKLILPLLTLTLSIILCACGNQSNANDSQLSGTYSYEKSGIDGSEMGFEDEELTLHYELKVSDDENILNINLLSERGNNVKYLYSEKVTIDTDKQIISDSNGTEMKYSVSGDSVTIPDLAGDTGDEVTLTKE